MKTSRHALPFFLSAALLSATASAQTSAPASAPASEAESNVTIDKPRSTEPKVNEIRRDNKTTEVEVKTGKTTYTLKANPQAGNAQRGMLQGNQNSVARFNVMEFGGKKAAKETPTPTKFTPAPPPPTIVPDAQSGAASGAEKSK
jgi:hypothetical protein